MGGGSAGSPSAGTSGAPYDLLGGQYASFSGGTPGFDWNNMLAVVGKGLQNFKPSGGPQGGTLGDPGMGSPAPGISEPIGFVGPPNTPQPIPSNNIEDAIRRILGAGDPKGGGGGGYQGGPLAMY